MIKQLKNENYNINKDTPQIDETLSTINTQIINISQQVQIKRSLYIYRGGLKDAKKQQLKLTEIENGMPRLD